MGRERLSESRGKLLRGSLILGSVTTQESLPSLDRSIQNARKMKASKIALG